MKVIKLNKAIVIDDLLSAPELLFLQEEARKRYKTRKPGTMRATLDNPVIRQDFKKNQVASSSGMEPFAKKLKKKLENKLKGQRVLPPKFSLGFPQLSYYSKGDFYAPHRDRTEFGLTLIIFIGEKNFRGGDFYLLEKKVLKIPYRPGRIILFPSRFMHEIKKVGGSGTRITLQYFLTSKQNLKKSEAEIVKARKQLAQVFLKAKRGEGLQDLVHFKQEMKVFLPIFEASYRYLHYALTKKIPGNLKLNSSFKNDFSLQLKNSQLSLKVAIEDDHVFVETKFQGKVKRFPFHYTIQKICEELLRLSDK